MFDKSWFRGKCVNTGEWVFGYGYESEGDSCHILTGIVSNKYPLWKEILPKTLGKWTGKHDKCGVCVYQGDVIRCEREYGEVEEQVFKVEKYHTGLYVDIPVGDYSIYEIGYAIDSELITDMLIMGNIHDNPKLTEEYGL